MTNQKSTLINFVSIVPGNWTVTGIGDTHLAVEGMGDVRITSYVNGQSIQGTPYLLMISLLCWIILPRFWSILKGILRGVLYVPDLGTNLLSIGTATAAGAKVLFTKDMVTISRNGLTLAEGQRAGETLYHLKIVAKETYTTSLSIRDKQMVYPHSLCLLFACA